MALRYKYESFKDLKKGGNYKARLRKKAIQSYRKAHPTVWKVDDYAIPRLTVNYLRHEKTNYEELLDYTESKDEYVMTKLMVLANIGVSFDNLSHESCKQMLDLIQSHVNNGICSNHYTWWERVKRCFRVVFNLRKRGEK